jgi:cyclophilin family peptidyl-prolyl cis-trans isomerase
MSTINGVTQIPSGGMAPGARITTRGGRQSSNFTPPPVLTPRADDPAQWAPDSVHQLAIMDISFGATKEVVVIALYPESAPQTVANFIDLCESKFFDGLAFHRAIENFLVQTGDPLTADEDKRDQWGTGGEDRSITAEIRRSHRVGSVAMARRSDNVNPSRKSNGSQFYISLGNYSALEGKYTVFGQVVSGLDVLQHISKMPVDSNDCPVARIEVNSIRVVDQKGPMASLTGEGAKKRFRPGATRGFFEKVLERVW